MSRPAISSSDEESEYSGSGFRRVVSRFSVGGGGTVLGFASFALASPFGLHLGRLIETFSIGSAQAGWAIDSSIGAASSIDSAGAVAIDIYLSIRKNN